MDWLIENYDKLLAAFGALVALASSIVVLTPSTKDDEILGKIVAFIERFSIFNKRTK